MIKYKKIRFIFLLFIALTVVVFADEKTDRVDKIFATWDQTDSPGCALGIIQNGELIYKKGYGKANLELDFPITPDSAFYMGSVSKQFVAMCIALLEKQGKLSLDDNIRKYLPEMPDYGSPITIRHLIYHTSGIRDYLSLEGIAGIPIGINHEKEVLEMITRQKELNFDPGEEHLYSNSGYFLLSVIVKKSSGKSLRQYAEEYIFKPLGMKNSRFHDDYRQLIKNRASGYYPAGKGKYNNFLSTFDMVGSGGLFSTVEDLFYWDQNFYHHKVGGKDIFNLMHKKGVLNSGEEIDYSFAIVDGEYKGLKMVEHGGALGGYRAQILRFPEQRFSVICLANLSSINPTSLAQQVADIYLSHLFKTEQLPEAQKIDKNLKTTGLPEERLMELVCDYFSLKSWQTLKLSLIKGNLFVTISGNKYPLNAISESEFHFYLDDISVVIEFNEPGEGKPIQMLITPEGQKQAVYESFKRAKPTPEQLKEYEGIFVNNELPTTVKFETKMERLYFSLGGRNIFLVPLIQDGFTFSGNNIKFIRDKQNKITAFLLDAGRVRNLRFIKK